LNYFAIYLASDAVIDLVQHRGEVVVGECTRSCLPLRGHFLSFEGLVWSVDRDKLCNHVLNGLIVLFASVLAIALQELADIVNVDLSVAVLVHVTELFNHVVSRKQDALRAASQHELCELNQAITAVIKVNGSNDLPHLRIGQLEVELLLELITKLCLGQLSIFLVVERIKNLPQEVFLLVVDEATDHVAQHLLLEEILRSEVPAAHENIEHFLRG